MASEIIFGVEALLLQVNAPRYRYTMPHDSTQGVGTGFYVFGGAVLLFLLLGTLHAFWNNKKWGGNADPIKFRRKKS